MVSPSSNVPARVGGVDLSIFCPLLLSLAFRPRPCGRGGFKPHLLVEDSLQRRVPARVGGVDLSSTCDWSERFGFVPARVGGVDLSFPATGGSYCAYSPRPCGRGGFKRFSS